MNKNRHLTQEERIIIESSYRKRNRLKASAGSLAPDACKLKNIIKTNVYNRVTLLKGLNVHEERVSIHSISEKQTWV